ncbi:protein timeless homolog [Schistocerca gregaria]|uniref:protein timeless homolog n=1 Tax=Schistocerca gregaria TaxID=7010 RepID=UPI00211EBE57|nr:protein timeless homolog [Schistocerca gregaria]
MSSLLFAELAATCNALGFSDGSKYYPDTHCKETVRDLIRYLRRDDENHEIRRHLGEAQVLQTDLLPILKQEWKDSDLFDVVIRLLVNLTNPALLLYREELPADKVSRNYYLQIISQLQAYKKAFTDSDVWEVIKMKLSKLLETEWEERGEEKSLMIERMLILARNVLQVPADVAAEKLSDSEPSVHDQVLWALHVSGMVDIFLYLASSENEQQYYMHILEIVSLMLREQKPDELAVAAPERSIEEKTRDEARLLAVRNEEIRRRQELERRFRGARHSRFGGTFVLKDFKSISDRNLIYHKPLNKLDDLSFDHEKHKVKTPKNRQPLKSEVVERRSAYSVRLFLKEFCSEFLIGAYNTLMYHVKSNLVRAKTQANDESYYLWAMKFFMEFNRNYKFQVKLVSETMSVQTFHFVQTQMESCYANMVCDKKKISLWSRRMHVALKAYQELLMTLIAMDKSDDAVVRNSSRVIKSNIFYVIEYRELIFTLLINFSETKMSRAYLRDLVVTAHIFLRMLEQFSAKGTIVVQKPVRSKPKRKKKPATVTAPPVEPRPPAEVWDEELGPQMSVALQHTTELPVAVPFDVASQKEIDDQKSDCVKKIQRLLRQSEFEMAIALLRAAREVWPENDVFGAANASLTDEYDIFRDIYIADLNQPLEEPASEQQPEQNEDADDEEDEEDDEEEDAEDEGSTAISEQSFQFMDFMKRFAHPNVVQSCTIVLSEFDRNTPTVNHSALKILHRIGWDCKMYVLLFQVSLFRIFQRVLDSSLPEHKELAKFAIFIIRKFAEVAKNNPKVYMELLFWKTSKEAYEVEYGYGSYQDKSAAAKKVWSEEEENELRVLYEEYMKTPDTNGLDVLDFIMKNMISQDRSRRGVTKKMREMGFILPKAGSRKVGGSSRPPKEWSEAEEAQLRQLFEEFKDAMDPLDCILARLDVKRPKNRVKDKIVELGLVADRKELRKKRARKSDGAPGKSRHKSRNASNSEGESGSDRTGDSSDSESDGSRSRSASPPPRGKQRPTVPAKKRQVGQTTGAARKPRGTAGKSTRKPAAVSTAELASILRDLMDKGMSEALKWISSSLEEEAADRESTASGDALPVPLLPINEAEIVAVDDPTFLKLLSALALNPPVVGQEVYWRIPGELSSAELRSRIEVINMAVEGRLPPEGENKANEESAVPGNSREDGVEDDSQEDVGAWLAQNVLQGSGDESADEEVAPPLVNDYMTPWSQNMRKAAREAALADKGLRPSGKEIPSPRAGGKKTRIRIASDSDSDSDVPLSNFSDSASALLSGREEPGDIARDREDNREASGSTKRRQGKRSRLSSGSDTAASVPPMGSESGSSREPERHDAYETGSQSSKQDVRHRKRRIRVSSDSETEEATPLSALMVPGEESTAANSLESGTKQNGFLDSDSDSDLPKGGGETATSETAKRTAHTESDEEGRQVKKVRRAVIIDDDDDD